MKQEKYAVVAIHGIGSGTESERKGFSASLAKLVCGSQKKEEYLWYESVWEGENESFDRVMEKIADRLIKKDIFPSVFSINGWRNRLRCLAAKIVCWFLKEQYGRVLVDYSMAVLDALFDFVRYLDSDNGRKMRAHVRKDIEACCKSHREGVVVVAHSLGSLIAHDALYEMVRESVSDNIRAFITIGSPIQWAFELREVDGKQEKDWRSLGEIPWFNFYYSEDPVSIDGPIKEEFFNNVQNERLDLPEEFRKLQTSWKAHCAYWKDVAFAAKVRSIIGLNDITEDECHRRTSDKEANAVTKQREHGK